MSYSTVIQFLTKWRWFINGLFIISVASLIFVQSRSGLGESSSARVLDRIQSVDIAVSLALLGQLPESSLVIDQQKDIRLAKQASLSETAIDKPLFPSSIKTITDISIYKTKPGDTVAELAQIFLVNPNSIYWSNPQIVASQLPTNVEILIPPPGIDGIVYKTAKSESISDLEKNFLFDAGQVAIFNNLIDEQLPDQSFIFIPNGRPIKIRTGQGQAAFSAKIVINNSSVLNSILGGSNNYCYGCRTVKAGEIIGKVGNTGWSTGPHLHLTIYDSTGQTIDPWSFLKTGRYVWPLELGSGSAYVSNGYSYSHPALDLATYGREGNPVASVADGRIIYRGCLWSNHYRFSTFGVIIDHGEFYSSSIHLQAPDNKIYNKCSINRRSDFGKQSVDRHSDI